MSMRNVLICISIAMTAYVNPFALNPAYAGPGQVYSTDINNNQITVPTYYANSPSGNWTDATGVAHSSGTPLRKFVDGLPGVPGVTAFGANNLGQYIPVAVPEKWVDPQGRATNDDYYEIGIVEYTEKMHSDLPKATTLRGYVQLETAKTKGSHIALTYPDGSPILDSQNNQVYAVDNPHYLGPLISATRGTPVRIKYYNLLPKGRWDGTKRNGDLFVPVDTTLMGAGLGPDSTNYYTDNRAVIHLHGGDTPWVSDGTPMQWIVPNGENTPFLKGDSTYPVPDMVTPEQGAQTLYYNNGEDSRLMFYHDHAEGTTRLNVYAGMAAGYLLTDPAEANAAIPTDQIPMVIQDKTFVPQDIAVQDAKWDTTHWGQYGDLWFPNVYEANQDPNSFDGTNPAGRWDYGPWFWPIFPAPEALPGGGWDTANNRSDASTTPEAFGDTPIVNGTAYPTVTVDPKAYRFRILNASNDKFFNLGLYVAADKTTIPADPTQSSGVALCTGAVPSANCTEVKMVPFVPGAAAFPTTGGLLGTGWGTPDARVGGVPDPATAGPHIIAIGSEGGLLPAPVDIPSTPINYEYNKRSVTVLNVLEHGLYIAAAERADVIIDFSQYAGQTLILYNDCPSPVPAGDPRLDYYTGDPDQTSSGGAPTTLPGYGPNTRTVMQIVVRNTTPAAPFNLAALQTALPAIYAASQPKPVVAETAYNAAFGGPNTVDQYARIFTGSATQHTFDFIAGDTLTYVPEGSTFTTTVNEGQVASIPVLNKAIQELFDTHGRMNATLGVELPYTSATIQTTIPLGYIDPATEIINDGETQIWKITHNGVDTHPVHFHLINVQVINRVGWDGTVKPPDANEEGWKETVKMNPLEDIIVAVRANAPKLPFGLPESARKLAPPLPLGSSQYFTQIDPATGNPATVTNVVANFGWEYVWHCHILGHEENDFMRPFVFKFPAIIANKPTNLTAVSTGPPTLTWTDATPFGVAATYGDHSNEIGFRIERAVGSGAFETVGTALANETTFTDTTATSGTAYKYRVIAFNAAGDSLPSNLVSLTASASLLINPGTGNFGNVAVNYTSYPTTFTISNIATSGSLSVTSLGLQAGGNSAMFTMLNGTCGAAPFNLAAGGSCNFAVTFKPTSTGSKTATIQMNSTDPAAPTQLIGLSGTGVTAATNPVRINLATPVYFTTLASAFASPSVAGNTIQAWGIIFTEPAVSLNTTGTVTFGGGYDTLFGSVTGTTALKGVLTVTKGTLVVGNLTIM